MKYVFPTIAVIALILGVFSLVPNKMLGGQYNFYNVFDDGITVSGDATMEDLTVSGTFTPATLSGYVTSSISALTISGTATTSLLVVSTGATLAKSVVTTSTITALYVNNGTNCTKISFASNSTTPTYATSTCP